MNLEAWMSQARAHWKEFQPTRFKELVKTGKLRAALKDAAERTYQEMTELEQAGFQNNEAWEMVRERYLFPPEEAALKAKHDREPVASEAARTFNELMRLKSELARAAHRAAHGDHD